MSFSVILAPALAGAAITMPPASNSHVQQMEAMPAIFTDAPKQSSTEPSGSQDSVLPTTDGTGQAPDALNEVAAQAPAGETPPKAEGDTIVVTGRDGPPVDPAEEINIVTYEVVSAVDDAIIAPVTHAYEDGVPSPLRDGFHNVINNLDEPIVFINFLLQLKPGKAIETAARFVINSTLGVAGLFDMAKKPGINLPRRSNGFADTLGYYGVGPGPYLFLPVIGSTTVRDVLARPLDLLILPAIAPKPFRDPVVALAKGTLSSLDERLQNDRKFKEIKASYDPYLIQREEYLARRKAEIEVLQGKRESIYDPPYYVLPDLTEEESTAILKASEGTARRSDPAPEMDAAPTDTVSPAQEPDGAETP